MSKFKSEARDCDMVRVHKRESGTIQTYVETYTLVPPGKIDLTHLPEVDKNNPSPLVIPPRPYPEDEIIRLSVRHGEITESIPGSDMKKSNSNIIFKSGSEDPLILSNDKQNALVGKIRLRYDDIMANNEIRNIFINFCIERLCLENIMFLEHNMELKKIQDCGAILQKVTKMYNLFLADDAIFQINTNNAKRAVIKKILDEGVVKSRKSISHTKTLITTLETISREVFLMIQTDILRSFACKYPDYFT